jgi:hypothetical protein
VALWSDACLDRADEVTIAESWIRQGCDLGPFAEGSLIGCKAVTQVCAVLQRVAQIVVERFREPLGGLSFLRGNFLPVSCRLERRLSGERSRESHCILPYNPGTA